MAKRLVLFDIDGTLTMPRDVRFPKKMHKFDRMEGIDNDIDCLWT